MQAGPVLENQFYAHAHGNAPVIIHTTGQRRRPVKYNTDNSGKIKYLIISGSGLSWYIQLAHK